MKVLLLYMFLVLIISKQNICYVQVKVDEQERMIRELDAALQRTMMDTDRKLMSQQKEYEQKMQLLMHQLAEGGSENGGSSSTHSLK